MKTVFISGQGDLTIEQFNTYYKQYIDDYIKLGYRFIVCDFKGADTMAQQYLYDNNYNNVIVYHMFDNPRVNIGNFKTIGNFTSDLDRDTKCTLDSDLDLIYYTRKGGAYKNFLRRNTLKS